MIIAVDLGRKAKKKKKKMYVFHSLPAICRLLITFENSLGPDQARLKVPPDLNPNLLDTQTVFDLF